MVSFVSYTCRMITNFEGTLFELFLGLSCILCSGPLLSARVADAILRFKSRHPFFANVIDFRRGGGVLSDHELKARGGFKIFTGILLLLLGLLFVAPALAALATALHQ